MCYTIDPKYPKLSFFDKLRGKKNPAPVFTNEYFLDKAKQMAALGADNAQTGLDGIAAETVDDFVRIRGITE